MCCGILSSNCFSRTCRFQEVNLEIFFLTYFLINRRQDVLFICFVKGFGSLVLVSLSLGESKQNYAGGSNYLEVRWLLNLKCLFP